MTIPFPPWPIRAWLRGLLCAAFLTGVLVPAASATSYVSTTNKYAWAENAGWLNLRPTSGGITINPNYLSGYAWHENLGWIKLGSDAGGPYLNTTATNWGVNRDQAGNLWGYAWSEGWGWINFKPANGGVTIDGTTGAFGGYAWGENFGWISFQSPAGASVIYGVGLESYTLDLVFNGTGTGSVTSVNPPFSCNTGCSKTYLEVTPLSLTAEASQYSIPGGWSDCDSATDTTCDITLDRNVTATVTFTFDTAHLARIAGATPGYFSTLQGAYNAGLTGDTIQVWGLNLNESLVCGNSTQVRISGGYDQQYLTQSGVTTIRGLTIGKGTVTVDRLVIR